jgi:hypothetical protein
MGAMMSFALIVVELGQDEGLEVANRTTTDILINVTIASFLLLLVNYFLTKKLLVSKRPFLISLTVTLIGIIVFIPFFLSARQSFLNYQNGTTQLQHYLDRQTIVKAQIISDSDTIQVKQLDNFLRDIGFAKNKVGPWKYEMKFKLVFKRTDGSIDSLFSNGQMFGVYKGKYFSTDQNVIHKYLDK